VVGVVTTSRWAGVTLSLAALGWLQVDGTLVEAPIGFSIAPRRRRTAVRGGIHVGLARSAAAGLALLAGCSCRRWERAAGDHALRAGALQRLLSGLVVTPGARGASASHHAALRLVHGFGFASVLARSASRERLAGCSASTRRGPPAAVVVAIVALGRLAQLALGPLRGLAADGLSSALCGLGLFWFLAWPTAEVRR
jgi:hypothetical protein